MWQPSGRRPLCCRVDGCGHVGLRPIGCSAPSRVQGGLLDLAAGRRPGGGVRQQQRLALRLPRGPQRAVGLLPGEPGVVDRQAIEPRSLRHGLLLLFGRARGQRRGRHRLGECKAAQLAAHGGRCQFFEADRRRFGHRECQVASLCISRRTRSWRPHLDLALQSGHSTARTMSTSGGQLGSPRSSGTPPLAWSSIRRTKSSHMKA
mmetsp:Transcript_115630/g.367573  ORF Transcript_115630/g.367573 Transcript_115630/m.367573 type:complete len:205 (-) Transcript_115630:423-1037(-)